MSQIKYRSCTFIFQKHIICYRKNGGAILLVFLSGLWNFLETAFFVLGYISGSKLFPEPLTLEEEKEILDRFFEGDEEARNILIERNLRLVAHIAKKYNIPNLEADDLISIGTIGLIKGINTFKKDKGVRLATYAARCIDKSILTKWQQMNVWTRY